MTDFGAASTVMRWEVAQVSAVTGNGHFSGAVFGINYDYPGTIFADGPVAYFRFEESLISEAVADEIASLDGVYNGSPTLQEAPLFRTGHAITLDGSSDYLSWDTTGESTDWIKGLEFALNINSFPGSSYDVVWAQEDAFSPSLSVLIFLSGRTANCGFCFIAPSGVQVINLAGAALSTGTDYHVIINWGYPHYGANVDIYIDDVSYASGTTSNSWQMKTAADQVLCISVNLMLAGMASLIGTIDDFSIWGSIQGSTQHAQITLTVEG